MSSAIRWLIDEDFNNDIVKGVSRLTSGFQYIRVQDIGLSGRPDDEVLNYAACENRVVLTHDVRTMLPLAWDRISRGLPMTGLLVVRQSRPARQIIDDIVLISECGQPHEWHGVATFLPL